jgi:hypothetical protein
VVSGGPEWVKIGFRYLQGLLRNTSPEEVRGSFLRQHKPSPAAKETVMFTFKSPAPSFRKQFGLQKLLFIIFASQTSPGLLIGFNHEEMVKGPCRIRERCKCASSRPLPHPMPLLLREGILKNYLEQ